MDLSVFFSCVVSVILPIWLLLGNFSEILAGGIQMSILPSRDEPGNFLPSLTLFFNFSWSPNDGVGTGRNTNGPSKTG